MNDDFTDEYYRERVLFVLRDDRYPDQLKAWMVDEWRRIYREKRGQEPPEVVDDQITN